MIQLLVFLLAAGVFQPVSSPDGRYVLYQIAGGSGGPELWIRSTQTGSRTHVLNIGGTVRAGWAPDSTAFHVNDRWASSSARALLYDAESLRRIDIGTAILAADAEARRFARGHAYFEVESWENPREMSVRFYGHTDESPVVCFEFRYLVNRTGDVRRKAERVSPVTDPWCDTR